MAKQWTIGGAGDLFKGEDKTLKLEVLDGSDLPVDIAVWSITMDVRLTVDASAPATLSKTATVSGTYNANRNTNTQRAVVTLTDTELGITATTYQHAWKRTDDGSETILAYGDFIVEEATLD